MIQPLLNQQNFQHTRSSNVPTDKMSRKHQEKNSWKMGAIALLIVAIAAPIFYKIWTAGCNCSTDALSIAKRIAGSNSSTDILPLAMSNPDRQMALTDVPDLAMNNTLQEINGNSI